MKKQSARKYKYPKLYRYQLKYLFYPEIVDEEFCKNYYLFLFAI